MKNNLTNIKSDNINKIDWKLLQNEMKNKFGSEIYDSWLKKIDLVDEFKNYVLLSVSTRFIRDWIVSRYLDQILQIIKEYIYYKNHINIYYVFNFPSLKDFLKHFLLLKYFQKQNYRAILLIKKYHCLRLRILFQILA